MSKYKPKYEIDKHELHKFICNTISSTFDTYDLGWWLETKTAEQFTIIQTQIIKDLFKLFNTQEAQVALFKDIFKNLDYVKRKIDSKDFLDENNGIE